VISILKKKCFLKIEEIYFAEENNLIKGKNNADVIINVQAAKRDKNSKEFHTLILNLTKDEEQLLSEMGRGTRRKVKSASNKGELKTVVFNKPSIEDIKRFEEFYNIFAMTKKLKKCDVKKILSLKDENAISISVVYDMKNNPLCYHLYIVDKYRVRLLYSASHYRLNNSTEYRSFVGIAHRYLHWNDIKHFKSCRYLTYDFGGLSTDLNNEELQNVNRFKEEFGGSRLVEYNSYKGVTIKGKIAIKVLKKGK